MRMTITSSATTVVMGALLVIGEVTANPGGVPVPESPPLVCNTSNFRVEAQTGPNGEFPKASLCNGNPCSEYGYTITSALNISHTIFAAAATQNLVATDPASFVAAAGAGDSLTGFLAAAVHEYSIRFNANGTVYNAKIFTEGVSSPRIGTALVRSGNKIVESCLIASPGIAGNVFQPVFTSQTILAAGGKCLVNLVFDASGNVINVTLAQGSHPSCQVGSPASGQQLLVNGNPLQNNAGPHGITFGTNTTTCWGPPIPSVPKCVCTAAPCP